MLFVLAAHLALATTQAAAEESDPSQCEFSSSWEDIAGRKPTLMIVRQDQSQFNDGDSLLVAFFNDDWSISKDDKLGRIKVQANDGGWFDNEATPLENGFAIWSSFKDISNVFDGYPSAMSVTRQGKTVDKLSITGLSYEWMKFKTCRDKKVSTLGEQKRKERLQREIPKDPFAK